MTTLASIDLETTGTDPDRHEAWEVAVILSDTEAPENTERFLWQLDPVLIPHADTIALNIGGYWERHVSATKLSIEPPRFGYGELASDPDPVGGQGAVGASDGVTAVTDAAGLARWLAVKLAGAHVIGANPAFDMSFLTRLFKRHGVLPSWVHRPIDVEGMAMDRLGIAVPTKLTETAALLDVRRDGRAHSALSDAQLAWDVYRHLTTTTVVAVT